MVQGKQTQAKALVKILDLPGRHQRPRAALLLTPLPPPHPPLSGRTAPLLDEPLPFRLPSFPFREVLVELAPSFKPERVVEFVGQGGSAAVVVGGRPNPPFPLGCRRLLWR